MNFVCEFIGGPMGGRMPLDKAEKIADGWSEDWSEDRAKGRLVPRAELDNRPRFRGYAGPMWDGVRPGNVGVLRYESWAVYEMMSN